MLRLVRCAAFLALGACSYTAGVIAKDAPDVRDSPDSRVLSWTKDTASGKATPATASEWIDFLKANNLNIAVPDGLWLMQNAGGSLPDAIGSVTLAANGAPAYQQSVPEWSRLAVAPHVDSSEAFGSTSMVLPDVRLSSMMVLVIYDQEAAPAGPRSVLFGGAGSTMSDAETQIDDMGKMKLIINTSNASGTFSYTTKGAFPLILKLDKNSSNQELVTNHERVAVPVNLINLVDSHGLLLGGANLTASGGRYLYMAAWYGPHGEVGEPVVDSLIAALGW